jgi:acetyl-CoA C-acetyltransferase
MISAGCAGYGKREGLGAKELFEEALDELFSHCSALERRDVDALYLGQGFESFEHQANTAAGISNDYGFPNIPSSRIESVSASGGAALRQAVLGLMSGLYDVVICGGVEKMTNKSTAEALEIISMASERFFEQWNGATLTSLNALAARVHMQKYGTTEQDLAMVAVKNHRNALDNPKAFFHKAITVDDVLSSRPISTPLKLLDCSPICDGASAIALCRPEVASKYDDSPISIIGSAEASDADFIFREDLTSFRATKLASKEAYDMCGIGPKDLGFAEVHDAFTMNELIAYEDLGFCEKGKGGKMIESHETDLEGNLPVNVSGGLKAKGHPVGSSGCGQVYEVFSQMKGLAAPSRSVNDPRVALTHSMGGAGVTVQVHIFQNE